MRYMIKQPIFFILMLFVSLPVFFLGSCTSENLVAGCDTLNMSYSQNIVPILKNNCYTCHSKGNTAGSNGILLDNYSSVSGWATIIQIDTTQPKNADSCYLVGNIKHLPPNPILHFTPMPYMKPQLDACSINQIVAWVNQGAKNN
jgi:hypothetical protein